MKTIILRSNIVYIRLVFYILYIVFTSSIYSSTVVNEDYHTAQYYSIYSSKDSSKDSVQ